VTAPKDAGDFSVSLFGVKFEAKPAENRFCYAGLEIPLSHTGGDVSVRILTDTIGVEVFLDGGLIYSTAACVLDKNLCTLTVSGEQTETQAAELENIH